MQPERALELFHPLVRQWFIEEVGSPSPPQVQGWPQIASASDVLISAPTGSGKTLAAFLFCIDALVREAIAGTLPEETRVVYVSPLKALSNDVERNLNAPLQRLTARAAAEGLSISPIRVGVRTGDTKAGQRAALVKHPPHILVTTPESLYLYLTAERARATLAHVRTIIVDEIHSLARDKRGSHFALSLERLQALTEHRPQRIGLSATQKPIVAIAHFLVGNERSANSDPTALVPRPCTIIEIGHIRPLELNIETVGERLSAVATHEMWGHLYARLAELTKTNRTVVVFANTRRLAERVAHDLAERIGKEHVSAHHGSMAKELRQEVEERLKKGELKVLVATASLELGLDIGSIDLVCQIGTPRSISVLLQRVGRAGHRLDAISKGIIFAMTRDELVECTALADSVARGELDATRIPSKPLDVLAQQIVASVAAEDWNEDKLFELMRGASPYQDLNRDEYESVIHMLSEGVTTRSGRSRVHLHRDQVGHQLRARRGAKLAALQNVGAIGDTFTYPVIAEPDERQVGTLDEDFAIESMAGDVFVLGTNSWRILRVHQGTVRVQSAEGQAPTIPFWLGEAPSRTLELSASVGRLRGDIAEQQFDARWAAARYGLPPSAAVELTDFLREGNASLGNVPTQTSVIAERFFDEAGGLQLIIHAPFGGRINRAWGMALRKSFCRAFDFELQAAATDDGILLSLGEQHSFPLEEIFEFLSPNTIGDVLTQAILQAPIFATRFRWVASRALALSRWRGGKRVPPIIQRARAEDLIASVFPDQVGCQDNRGGGDIEPPNHPLVNETLHECKTDALDLEGLRGVLGRIKRGEIHLRAVDVPEPSVFAHQLLNSAPYTYLDDAPLEERRARAVATRRTLGAADAGNMGALDQSAIDQVIREALPEIRNPDEMHDLLLQLGFVPLSSEGAPLLTQGETDSSQLAEWGRLLVESGRAYQGRTLAQTYLYATERIPWIAAITASLKQTSDADVTGGSCPTLPMPAALAGAPPVSPEQAEDHIIRGWMELLGPVTSSELASQLGLQPDNVLAALYRIEREGQVLRGFFRPARANLEPEKQWCSRRLLQRIHRLTVGRLRKEIEPLSSQDFMRFVFDWQRLSKTSRLRGKTGLLRAITLLEGYEAPLSAWEEQILPARVHEYDEQWLSELCLSGEVAWGRLSLRNARPAATRRGAVVSKEPTAPRILRAVANPAIALMRRSELHDLLLAARGEATAMDLATLSPAASDVYGALKRRGALFFAELVPASRRLAAEVENALWELVSGGLVSGDAIDNLRIKKTIRLQKRRRPVQRGGRGRWSLLEADAHPDTGETSLDRIARLMLTRYGIVFRDLLERETIAPPWRELASHYRVLEARGEIRGGRFVSGYSGEQFALQEAVDRARQVRRVEPNGERIVIGASDPLNLTGTFLSNARVATHTSERIVFLDGVLVAEPTATIPTRRAASIEALRHNTLEQVSPQPGAE